MIKTKIYYSIEILIRKIQSTNIKLNSNFEILTPINNVKVLQNIPLIIILGEEHTLDENKESYYTKDLEKIAKIAKVLEIENLFLEGIAKGQEKNIQNTILNAEVELIKYLDKNKKYNLFGVENLDIQIKIFELGFLVNYSNYFKLIQDSFGNLIVNENFKVEINNLFGNIFNFVVNKKNDPNLKKFNVSPQLYLSMQQTKIDFSKVFEEIEHYYLNLLLHLNSLKIFPRNFAEFYNYAMNLIHKFGFNIVLDKKKIEELHFKYISSVRDEIFVKNILDSIKENNISTSIFVCGKSHMKPVAKLIQKNCEKNLGTKVNIVSIDIT